MRVMIYYDYTCQDSYQVYRWLEKINAGRPDLHLSWTTFSACELSRGAGEISHFERDAPGEPAITALALAHAARQANFRLYHHTVFDAVQGEGTALTEAALLEWAWQAGVDIDDFRANRPRWLQEAAHDHEYGRRRWGVHTTPTLVINGQIVAELKFSNPPHSEQRGVDLLDRLTLLLMDYPELLEVRRPEG